MTEADIPAVLGYLFTAWAIGWGCGHTFYAVKRGIEKIM